MKMILLVLSGAFDRPSRVRNFRTPLEVAATPGLDWLAQAGSSGTFDIISPGIPVDPHMALFLLLGGKARDYPGKGYYLARARGLDQDGYDTFIEAYFARVRRRDDFLAIEKTAPLLGNDVYDKMTTSMGPVTVGDQSFDVTHIDRGQALIRTAGGSRFVSFSMPFADGSPVKRIYSTLTEGFGDVDPEIRDRSIRFASSMNGFIERSFRTLDTCPVTRMRRDAGLSYANFLVTASCGMKGAAINPHQTLEPSFVSDDPVASLVMEDLGFSKASYWDGGKEGLRLAIESFMRAPESKLLVVYWSGAREISRLGQFDAKKVSLEKADELAAEVKAYWAADTVIAVTSDSYALTSLDGRYCGDPIPFLISGANIPCDGPRGFTEKELMKGGQGRVESTSFLDIVLSYANEIGCYFLGDRVDMLYTLESDEVNFAARDDEAKQPAQPHEPAASQGQEMSKAAGRDSEGRKKRPGQGMPIRRTSALGLKPVPVPPRNPRPVPVPPRNPKNRG